MLNKIKKFLPIVVLILGLFMFSTVFAEEEFVIVEGCDGVLGNINDKTSAAYFLQQLYNVFKYGVPLICIVLTIMEYLKAVTNQDKDALMKATKRTGIRIVLCLALFVIPALINFLFPLFGWNGTCEIG